MNQKYKRRELEVVKVCFCFFEVGKSGGMGREAWLLFLVELFVMNHTWSHFGERGVLEEGEGRLCGWCG